MRDRHHFELLLSKMKVGCLNDDEKQELVKFIYSDDKQLDAQERHVEEVFHHMKTMVAVLQSIQKSIASQTEQMIFRMKEQEHNVIEIWKEIKLFQTKTETNAKRASSSVVKKPSKKKAKRK